MADPAFSPPDFSAFARTDEGQAHDVGDDVTVTPILSQPMSSPDGNVPAEPAGQPWPTAPVFASSSPSRSPLK